MRRRIYGSSSQGLKPITILDWKEESKDDWILLKTNTQELQDYAKITFALNILRSSLLILLLVLSMVVG